MDDEIAVDPSLEQGALASLSQQLPVSAAGNAAAKMDPFQVIERVMRQRQEAQAKPVDTTLNPQERNQILLNLGLRLLGNGGDRRGLAGIISDAGISSVNDVAAIKNAKLHQAAAQQKSAQDDSRAILNYLAKVHQKDKPTVIPKGGRLYVDGKIVGGEGASGLPDKWNTVMGPDGIPRINAPGRPEHGQPVFPGVDKQLTPEQAQHNEEAIAAQQWLTQAGVFKDGKIVQDHPFLQETTGPDGLPVKHPLAKLTQEYIRKALTPQLNPQGKEKADQRLVNMGGKFQPKQSGFSAARDTASGKIVLFKDGKEVGQYGSEEEAKEARNNYGAKQSQQETQGGALSNVGKQSEPKTSKPNEASKAQQVVQKYAFGSGRTETQDAREEFDQAYESYAKFEKAAKYDPNAKRLIDSVVSKLKSIEPQLLTPEQREKLRKTRLLQ